MVYPDDPVDVNDSSDVFLVRYYVTRSGWVQDGPVRVNDDTTTHDQWSPTIALSPDGSRLFIGFYDRRLDPQNLRIHTFGAIADIDQYGAFTLQPNFQISSVNFPPPDDNLVPFISDYDAAQADENFFYYSWGDLRNIFLDEIQPEPEPVPNNESNIRFTKITNE
jgi:hypothetical protein